MMKTLLSLHMLLVLMLMLASQVKTGLYLLINIINN